MAKDRSFTNYVADRFYNELFDAIKNFIRNDPGKLDLYLYKVKNMSHAWLNDIYVRAVSVNDCPEMRITFTVIVEADMGARESDYHYDETEECGQWFSVECSGDLACDLNDFAVHSVDVYNGKKFQPVPLSDALVPYISAEEYEEVALDFLRRNYPEALQKPMAIEPDVLAKKMGLDIMVHQITDDFSVFGEIFFCDSETKLYDAATGEYIDTHINGKTIVVDPQAYFLRNLGSVNNTIIHECVHWDKHRKAFELERLFNKSATQIKCQVVGGVKDSGNMGATDWMERHANALAPRIQMPLPTFKMKAHEYIRECQKESGSFNIVDVMEWVIDSLATFFCVSRCAAKIRMVDAGYEEAIGVFTYVDDHYVRPHCFKKGAIGRNQTFSISLQDALVESAFSPKLKEKLQSGNYLYVDSHFCFNSSKYITEDEEGKICLTDYARHHMDECCLVFDLKVKAINKYGEQFFTECVLYRDAASGVVFIANYSDNNSDHQKQIDTIKQYNQDLLAVIRTLPQSFSGALDALIKWSEMTEEELAWESGLSEKTIQRLRNQEPDSVTIETVVQLCIGMQLPPQLSSILMRCSGNNFMMTEQHIMYQFLLGSCYTSTLDECNEMLESQNLKPLGRKNRSSANI